MSPYESASLITQWVSAIASVVAVAVAALFGMLTLANTRRSKDAQERATYAAITDPMPADFAQSVAEIGRVNWAVEPAGGETWMLRNVGTNAAYDVVLAGLTELDRRRLTIELQSTTVGPTGAVDFHLVSRLTLSGPANIVVTFRLEENGPESQRVVKVPSS